MTESPRLRQAQRLLLVTLALGLIGAEIELFLLEHTGDRWQIVPLVVIPLSLLSLAWHARARSSPSARTLLVVMIANVLAGVIGTFLHYRGNVEFEREMAPALTGVALFREAMMGATPALAPGSMSMFGLLGLLYLLMTRSMASDLSEGQT